MYFLKKIPWNIAGACGVMIIIWTQWYEFKSWTRLIVFHIGTNTFEKGMNPIILLPAMGK